MTNSMIPYSFIPGTKAKAGEVNANFIALANVIEQNKSLTKDDILEVKEIMKEKADKTELTKDNIVTTGETDLNNYKTRGTYFFSPLFTPLNIPKGNSGTLFVINAEESVIKQIWFCDAIYGEIFIRDYKDENWTEWSSITGKYNKNSAVNSGYLKLSNGLILQWGKEYASKVVTYPLAFSAFVCPVVEKNGCGTDYTRSDFGVTAQSLTGFTITTSGKFFSQNWIAIGY